MTNTGSVSGALESIQSTPEVIIANTPDPMSESSTKEKGEISVEAVFPSLVSGILTLSDARLLKEDTGAKKQGGTVGNYLWYRDKQ